MKKLPKMYKNNVNKKINNNTIVFYGSKNDKNKEINIEDYFLKNKIYRKEVKITLNDKVIIKNIIGRTTNHLITMDNELINIQDIKKIEET
jgi:hypothetical protein